MSREGFNSQRNRPCPRKRRQAETTAGNRTRQSTTWARLSLRSDGSSRIPRPNGSRSLSPVTGGSGLWAGARVFLSRPAGVGWCFGEVFVVPYVVPLSMAPKSIHLRLPRDLHDEVRKQAEQQGVSLNTLLATLLAGSIGWKLPNGAGSAP